MPKNNAEIWDSLYNLAYDYYEKGMDFEQIHKKLIQQHNDEAIIFAIIKKIKADHYAKSAKEGRKFLLIGLVLILAGFLITCINFHSNKSIAFAMYGLTSAGLIVVFYALYKIIG